MTAPSNANTSGLAPTDALHLVPVEPTREMIEAGASREWSATYNTPEWKAADRALKADYRKQAKLTFKAMLAAAPASPLPGGGDEALIAELKEARGLLVQSLNGLALETVDDFALRNRLQAFLARNGKGEGQ